MSRYMSPKPVVGDALLAYFEQYATKFEGRPGFWKVQKPLPCFKKVEFGREHWRRGRPAAIANLVIPAGAEIFAAPSVFTLGSDWFVDAFKMRASAARVHSIVSIEPPHRALLSARSNFNPRFRYRVGQTMKPTRKFSEESLQCAAGIHFFLNVEHALSYCF